MSRRAFWHSMVALLLLHAMAAGQSSWEEKNRAGEKAFQEGHLAEASGLFSEALRDAQKFGPNDVRLAPIYNNLALIAFVQNNFITAEILYQRAIAIMEAQGQENPLLLPVLDNLTSLYVKQWAFGKAIQTSWRAYHIREKKFGPASLETAAGLDKLATLYLDCVRLLPQSSSDKLPAPETANRNPFPANSTTELKDLSASYENALALDDATKLSIAEALFSKVLEAQEKAYGKENTRLIDVLENLGEVLHAEGKLGPAEEAYTRAVVIVEKSFGPDDPKLAMPVQQLAELKTEDGKYADAEKLYKRALQIDESNTGATDPALRDVLTGYATLLEKMNRSAEAATLTLRARSLAAPQTLKNVAANPAGSVPYVLRFERSVYDRYAGVQRSCMLIRADGRFRVEEQPQERTESPITGSVQRSPDGMPDLNGLPQETLANHSVSGSHGTKVFESSLDGDALQQLRAILSAKDIRDIQGSYPPRGEASLYYSTEKIAVSILRDDGVQNFAFPDTAARQPYERDLKPLFRWLSTAEKHKGSVVKEVAADNCLPDTPTEVPMQFSASKPTPHTETTLASDKVAYQGPHDVSQDKASTMKVQVNLVLVRVVARDSQGHAIGTLRQEDFRLLDNGKPQLITKFSVEQPSSGVGIEPKAANVAGGENGGTPSAIERSVAYLFDDIHLDAADLNQVRAAADRQLSSLQAAVQAAIFTTSGQTTLDFTQDRSKLHETLFHIQPRQVASSAGNDCPSIDTYLADLISNKHDQDALDAAAADALICAYGDDARFARAAENMAKATAREQIGSAEAQGRIILGALQTALRRLAATPGQRTLVLVSSGFLVPGYEQQFGQLIDYALHSDIVINALDARGLYQIDSVAQRMTTLQYRQESASANDENLASFANATGGSLFKNSNDLAAGFSRMAGAPEYSYMLGFSPRDQELDGRFHNLSVSLNGGVKLMLQARKGYYARKQ
ncbi:MAG: VWA domain-containing protein [Terriglobales bacterium]